MSKTTKYSQFEKLFSKFFPINSLIQTLKFRLSNSLFYPSPKTYAITSLAFSPDSTKLSVAQSDNIVYVYKLGSSWSDKKTICNKYLQSSPVTCVLWLKDLIIGCVDGRVRLGNQSNKSITL